MANLYQVLMDLMAKQQGKRDRGDTGGGELYLPGTVVAINADGTYQVSFRGATLTATPETDLPLSVGQPVYVSQVRNGRPLVHGPRR